MCSMQFISRSAWLEGHIAPPHSPQKKKKKKKEKHIYKFRGQAVHSRRILLLGLRESSLELGIHLQTNIQIFQLKLIFVQLHVYTQAKNTLKISMINEYILNDNFEF